MAGWRRLGLGLIVAVLAVVAPASPARADRVLLWAQLSGANAVPPPGDPDGFGYGAFTVDDTTNQVCAAIVVRNIQPSNAAHVHIGIAGQTGGPAVHFAAPTPGWSYSCGAASQAVIDGLLSNPGGYYLNVHNAEYPRGAIRGQLRFV
ncbi:MAG: CHRD domain-containing protein [Acidimicrobiales bacterium]